MNAISIRVLTGALALLSAFSCLCATDKSQVLTREFVSKSVAQSKIGTDPLRKMVIYLPAAYDSSRKRYPVIYYLPSPFRNYRDDFDHRQAEELIDQSIAAKTINPFILVAIDMTTPLGCSWYCNSPVTGNWEDFAIRELVPYMDGNFRTLAQRDSRGIAGDFMGAYGALRLSMRHPEVFGSVYGLGPVALASGVQLTHSRTNWQILEQAKSLDDVKKDSFTQLFTAVYQAHLPNPDKPPLFIDFAAHKNGNQLVVDATLTDRLRKSWLLEEMVPQYADNLKLLRGMKFDWPRSDSNYDHVYGAQAFTHKLNEFGIAHEADEYNGIWEPDNWDKNGRMYTQALPFFQLHLLFEPEHGNH